MADQYPWLARLLQVNDSAFPTGGYAHSYGFEQVVRFGLVHDAESMSRHLADHVWPMLIHFELPVVRLAQEAAQQDSESELIELDSIVEATKTAQELRDASRFTGRQRLGALIENAPSPILTQFARAVKADRTPGHHAAVFGLGLAALPQQALLTSWAFQSLSAICLSAPKLLRIGQVATQRVLTTSLAEMDTNVTHSLSITRDELGWFDPLLEIASMQHQIAYERLFIS